MDEEWEDPIDALIEESMDYEDDSFPEEASDDDSLYIECDVCGGNWYDCDCSGDDTDIPDTIF